MFSKANKKQVLLILDRSTRNYFMGIDIAEGYLLYGQQKVFFTDSRYYYMAKNLLKDSDTACLLYKDFNDIKEYVKSKKFKTIYIDFNVTTLSEFKKIKSFKKKVKDGSEYIARRRIIKSEKELSLIKKACDIASSAYHNVIKTVKVGITEQEVAKRLEEEMLSLGATGLAFETIVAFGSNSAVPHHVTGETVLENEMPILVDMGCKVNGYCSDITRMAYAGEPSKKFLSCFDAVLTTNEFAEEKIVSEMPCKEADKIAREKLKEYGIDEYFTHSLGHGIGLDIHEKPTLSLKGEGEIKDGMVFSIEPGIYFDGEFGIRIEDTVMVRSGKVVRLTDDEKKLIII